MHKSSGSLLPSLMNLRSYVRFLARKTGYELVGDGDSLPQLFKHRLYPRTLPDAIYAGPEDPYYKPLRIAINSITSRIGFSYAEDGWHPFVETLKEYAQDPQLRYEDSTLFRLYSQYCPQNAQEVLLDHIKSPIKPLCDWPPSYELISWVWTLNKGGVRNRLGKLKSSSSAGGWILFGPHTHDYGKKEFTRLLGVYESIKNNGYKLAESGTDPVNGYFLKEGANFRFVLLQGNHRVSVLKALGHAGVDVVIRQGHPAVIDRDNLSGWTDACGGIYPSLLTQQLFDALFTETGLPKAMRYGLAKHKTAIKEQIQFIQ